MMRGIERFIKKHLRDVIFFGTLVVAAIFSILSFVPNLPFAVTYHIAFFPLIIAMGEFYIIARKYVIPERGIIVSKSFRDNIDYLTRIAGKDGSVDIDAFAYNTNTYYGAILLNAINAHCIAVFLPQRFVSSSLRAFARTSSSFPCLATKSLSSSVRVYDVKEYIKSALRSNNVKIGTLRVLLYKGGKYDDNELRNNVARWHELESEEIVKSLQIKFYEFEPSFYFSVYSRTFLHWGVFKRTTNTLLPFDTSVDYGFLGHEKFGDSLIVELNRYFENIWENHSHQDKKFIDACTGRRGDGE